MPNVAASLTVNREHLLQSLRQIKKLTGLTGQPAVLTYTNGELKIALGGCTFRADAEGDWHGQATVPLSFMQSLAKAPPEGDGSIEVSTDGESLRIGPVLTDCKWDGLLCPRIELPLGATLTDKLILQLTYSIDDIERSDLTKTVELAENERDERIGKAASILQPLGIEEADVNRLLDSKLRKTIDARKTRQ